MNVRGILTAASLLAAANAGSAAVAQVRIEGPRVDIDIPDRRPDPRTGADMAELVGGLFALRDGYDRSRRGYICVLTYEDRNGNGRRDRGEGPLPGWSFAIADAAGTTVDQGQTGKEGRFCNERPLSPGVYSVRQSPGGGWTNTEPGAPLVDVKPVTLPAEQSVTVLFGNCRGEGCARERRDEPGDGPRGEPRDGPRGDTRAGPGDPTPQTSTTVCVRKFNDINGNGVKQGFDQWMGGWQFILTWPTGAQTTMQATGTGGSCFTSQMPAGTYTLTETPQAGWLPTTPGGQTQTFTLTPGVAITRIFGNRNLPWATAQLCVTKYHDLDGDGVRDAGEPLLPGWSFTVKTPLGGVLASGATNAQGHWCATSLPIGPVEVHETPQAGWTTTDPAGTPPGQSPKKGLTLTPGQTASLAFGNRAPPPPSPKVCVTKYNDLNGNGVRDAGEPVLAGWFFEVRNLSGAPMGFGTTNAQGLWCSNTIIPPGPATVVEQPQAGWVNTDPGNAPAGTYPSKPVTLATGQTVNLVFGNRVPPPPPPTGQICVAKYRDLNGNGAYTPGEPEIPNWAFTVTGPSGPFNMNTGWAGVSCTPINLPLGTYTITEVMQPGWSSTDPGGLSPQKTVNVVAGPLNSNGLYTIFGNIRALPGQVCVNKFEDLARDRQYDGDEPMLAGFTFELHDASGVVLATGVTDAQGRWCTAANLAPGVYKVVEIPKPGWVVTSPQGPPLASPPYFKTVSVTATRGAEAFFGNIRAGRVCIFKYNDLNGNGHRDPGEPPLAGMSFRLQFSSWMSANAVVLISDANGMACADLPPGSHHRVDELVTPGWLQTEPAAWNHGSLAFYFVEYTVVEGQTTNLVFGNHQPPPPTGRVCVAKYEDLDGDGQRDANEPLLPGWTFHLGVNGSATLTTGPKGSACTLVPVGAYTMTEQPQADWINTDPAGTPAKPYTVVADQVVNLLFGNQYVPPPPGRVCVIKYVDANGNGQRDPGEAPRAGVSFKITDASGAVVAQGVTDAQGEFCSPATLEAGTYTVAETVPAGWTNTDPGGIQPMEAAIVTPGQTVTATFGNRQNPPPPLPGEICVEKYNDLNGNGVKDAGEPALPAWQFTARDGSGAVIGQGATGANGRWCLQTMLPPGAYTVTETVQAGWTSTEPGGLTPTRPAVVISNQTTTVRFGNRAAVASANLTITKTKLTAGACHGSQPGANNCTFRFTVTNTGGAAYTGPLSISDTVTWGGSAFPVTVATPPPGWTCSSGPQTPVVCGLASATIPPGGSVTYDIELNLNAALPAQTNCAVLTWTGGQTPAACVPIFP